MAVTERAQATAVRPPRPPDPLAADRYLARQRAGFGTPQQAAVLGARAQLRARALRPAAPAKGSALVIPGAPGAAAALASPAGTWRALGPAPVSGTFYGGAASGRVDAIAVVPSGPNAGEIFIGAAGGGVWSSSDGGAHWATHTDQVTSGLAIGALAIDPSNPQIVYAGTGEANNCGDCYYGGGVLKSTDGGGTWTVENPGGLFSGVDFSALAVDPHNGQHLYAATTAGLYESFDGGASWARPSGSGDFTDAATAIALDPATTPATAYVATSGDGVQKSSDGGADFATLGGGLPSAVNIAGAALGLGAATPAHPSGDQTLYAAVALSGITDPGNGGQLSLYRSTDAGATWTLLSNTPAYANQAYAFGTGSADQATFDNTVAVDPADPAHLVVGGISALESTDGGVGWQDLNGQDFFGAAANVLHPDFHAAAFTPSGHVVLGCDGGVFGYDPSHPGRAGVANLNQGLGTLLAYADLGVYGSGSAILAGLQDNGTASYGGTAAWPAVLDGNGGYGVIDPAHLSHEAAENDGHVFFTTDGWSSTATDITPPGEPDAGANFVPPLVLAPGAGSGGGPALLYGGGDLWRTTTPAAASPAWTRLTSVGAGVSAIAVAPSDLAVVYVGFDDGTLEVSTNATAASPTFTALHPGVGQWITHIAVSPSDPGQIAVTYSDSNTHTYAVPPMVQTATVSLSGTPSATFADATGNLPGGVASNSVLYDDGSLVVATDVGVFSTPLAAVAGSATVWAPLGSGLPGVQVLGLTLDSAGDLFAATHGRGIWELAPPPAPAQTALPAIAGAAVQGHTLTEVAAGWSGTVSARRYQWLRCTALGCQAIAGATGTSYLLSAADVGATVRVSETAVAPGGASAAALSGAVGPVAALSSPGSPNPPGSPPPGPPKPPPGPPVASTAQVRAALARLLRSAPLPRAVTLVRHGWTLAFTPPQAGRVVIWLTVRAGRHHRLVPVARLSRTVSAGHHVRLRLLLTALGRRLLGRGGRLVLHGSLSARGRRTVSLTRALTLRR